MLPSRYIKYLFPLLLFIGSCQTKTESTIEKKDSVKVKVEKIDPAIIQENKVRSDTVKIIVEDQEQEFPKNLRKYLSKKEVAKFIEARKYYLKIKSSKEVAHFYSVILPELYGYIEKGIRRSHPEVYLANDNTPAATWEIITNYLPMIRMDYMCSECGVAPVTNVLEILKLAKRTPEKEDDNYCYLLIKMYELDLGDRPLVVYETGGNWYTIQNWVCGYINLGSGLHLELLKLSDKCLASGTSFTESILRQREFFFPSGHLFWGTEEEVRKELNAIEKQVKLTEEEKAKIKELKDTKEKDKEAQYDCKTGECKIDC
jgi:hypothetical protein